MTIKLLTLFGLACIVCVSGCARMNKEFDKHDRSKVYLQSDKYMAKRIIVPGDLDSSNMEDYYVVPTIADQGDPKVPNLQPPREQIVAKSLKQGAA